MKNVHLLDRQILHALRAGLLLCAVCAMASATSCQFGVAGGSATLSAHFTGITAATPISPNSVTITWQPQAGYTGYMIFSSSQDHPVASFTTGSSYTMTGLLASSTYSFSVVGTDPDGNQYGMDNQIQATTWKNFSGATQAVAIDSNTIGVAWSYNIGPTFNIYYNVGSSPAVASGNPPVLLAPNLTTLQPDGFNVSGLQASTNYSFSVVAVYADGTNSVSDSQVSSGQLTAGFTGKGTLAALPTITTQATISSNTPPTFVVSNGSANLLSDFYLYDPTQSLGRGAPLASINGDGMVVASAPLAAGTQTVVVGIQDVSQPGGTGATAVITGISVLAGLPNNGIAVVNATTPSAISPLPKISTNPISLGAFPLFTVSGSQPSYVTTLYNSANVALGTVTGNGTIKTNPGTPLPQGMNTLYAVVTAGQDSATVNGIQVKVRNIDAKAYTPVAGLNAGVGMQGVGTVMSVGDFNCDGYPDLAVGAPYGNGQVYVYYGTSTGLDFSAAPSITPSGPTKPLFIPSPTSYPLMNGGIGTGAYDGLTDFGVSLAAGNFNGYHDPVTGNACLDLAVGASALGNGGTVFVFYGSTGGLQTNGGVINPTALMSNQMTCTGAGGNSCQPEVLQAWSSGVSYQSYTGYNAQCGYPGFCEGIGFSLAAGDIDGDGYDDLVAGAPYYDVDFTEGMAGNIFMWRGTPIGVSPSAFTYAIPDAYTGTSAGTNFVQQGISVAIGHFVSTQKGQGTNVQDIAVSFNRLSTSAPGAGTNWAYQSGVAIFPGNNSPTQPVITDGAFHPTTVYLITPTACNWANQSACAQGMHGLIGADVNQDGYDDLIIGAPFAISGGAGKVLVYYGGPPSSFTTEVAATPSVSSQCPQVNTGCTTPLILTGPTATTYYGTSLGYLGDVNGDGFPDIGVGAILTNVGGGKYAGVSYILHGSAQGLSNTAYGTINPSKPAYSYFGASLAGANFSSANGFFDLYNLSYYNNSNSVTNPRVNFDTLAVGAPGESPPQAARNANGVVTNPLPQAGDTQSAGTISVFANSSPGFGLTLTNPTTLAAPTTTPSSVVATGALIAGDLNGDGYSDVIVKITIPGALVAGLQYDYSQTALQQVTQYGFIVYYGSSQGLITSPTPSYTPVQQTDPLIVTNFLVNGPAGTYSDPGLGLNIIPAGDTNGDGYADILASSTFSGYPTITNWSYLFYGSASGLVVSPAPTAVPYDSGHRPSLNPMIASLGMAVPFIYAGSNQPAGASGDFNGDGYSDIAMDNYYGVVILYGSSWGLVTGGNAYIPSYSTILPSEYAAAPAYDKTTSSGPTCSGTPLVCTPLYLNIGVLATGGIFNAGDMDGDHTDDLVLAAQSDPNWIDTEGTLYIYYGNTSNGIDPNLFVDLRISTTVTNRELGNQAYGYGAFGRAYDINGDGLADFVVTSIYEQKGYVVYGLPGNSNSQSPTSTSGAYLNQGLCEDTSGNPKTSYPCYVSITPTPTAGVPNYNPANVLDVVASAPNHCSSLPGQCNVLRFPLPGVGVCYRDGVFGVGDLTGDGLAEVVYAQNCTTVNSTAGVGQFYIYPGSAGGLQVTGQPTTQPSCYANGSCDPMLLNMPQNTPQIPAGLGPSWVSYDWNYGPPTPTFLHGTDVDGDGYNDFLVFGKGINTVDGAGNVLGAGMGGFFLFH